MTAWLSEMRQTLRRLAKMPVFVLAVILSIGLGIAANATIFSMVSRFVLSPAPVGDPNTLVALHTTTRGECCNHFSWPLFSDLREQSKSFSGFAAYQDLLPASIGGNGEPERVWGQATTANYFDVAQLGMTLGRGFTSDEEKLPVIVLGHRLWQRRFGADPAIAGKTILLSGNQFTVVGVAPPAFRGIDVPLDPEFWVTLGNLDKLLPKTSNYESYDYHWLAVAGRLKPGVTRAQAAAELQVLAQRFAQAHAESEKDGGFRFETAGTLSPRDREAVMIFLGALTVVVLLVLCIACANVANLLLAQVSGRQREMAVRLAVGATRGQLMRQLLTESVVLALGGGLLGVVLSLWATRALSTFQTPAPVPLDLSLRVDWRVLLYTFAVSAGSGLLFGLAPAWAASRTILSSALKGEDMLARPGRRWTLRNVLVVAQIAMSLVLLCATGLFLRSLQSANGIDVGFRSNGILMMSVDPREHGYTAERTVQLLGQLRERVAALPGVSSAACTDVAPLSMGNRSDGFSVEGRPETLDLNSTVDLYMATAGYFDAMGIPLIAGRDFANEGATAAKVAVVNEALVAQLFKKENPIGQRVSGGGVTYQVVGIVKNTKSRTLGEQQRPVLYRSLAQSVGSDPSFLGYTVVVRSEGDAAGLAGAVRGEIRALDPTLAVFNIETMEEHLRGALFLPRLAGTLFGVFGCVGLVLAAVGLYGVVSYSVSRRTREIGIRMALGAQSGGVQRLIVRQGMALTFVAVMLGLGAAFAVTKLFTSILYGIRPHDILTFTVVPVFLAGVALLACWIPSRRAARVDPLAALRYE
ncbi:MAG TPA: ABC transporter permease [Verrucomicrobiae bacterium]|jgi:putative ABC transport system permease protein|nr:ABC transporter permease [Verrucomicrobiae bacterium]